MDKKPVTRKDIAELCEVSISVVSRALNNSGYVEESKRKKNHSNSRKVRLCSTTSSHESTGTENKTTFILL